nr:Chain 8, Genome polyprotein, Coat protein VP1 [Poliovirus 1]
PALTAVETGAT